MIAENGVDFIHLPLLDVCRVGIREPEQAFAEMPDDRVFVKKFLVVEFLRQQYFFCGAADDRALIGKNEFLCPDQLARFFEKPRFAAFFHIEEKYARIDIVRIDEVFPVMISRRGVFRARNVDVVKGGKVVLKENVYVEVKDLVRDLV